MNGKNHIHKLGLKLNFKMDFSDHGNDSQTGPDGTGHFVMVIPSSIFLRTTYVKNYAKYAFINKRWSTWPRGTCRLAVPLCVLSCVQLFAALWTVACQAPLLMGFSALGTTPIHAWPFGNAMFVFNFITF